MESARIRKWKPQGTEIKTKTEDTDEREGTEHKKCGKRHKLGRYTEDKSDRKNS